MAKKNVTKIIIEGVTDLVASDKARSLLFGEYSDGTPRSLPDCLDGEILSPKDRKNIIYGKQKKKKQNKKKSTSNTSSTKKSPKKKMGKIDT